MSDPDIDYVETVGEWAILIKEKDAQIECLKSKLASQALWEIEGWSGTLGRMPMWYFRWFRHPEGNVALYRWYKFPR